MHIHTFNLFFASLLLASNVSLAQAPANTGEQEKSRTSWFTHQKIDANTWVINDNQHDNIYLVEGEESALVIDTGLGYQNLKSYINKITDKPLAVVNSHAHPDHAGGNHVFEHVHIHKNELKTLEYYTSEPVMIDTFRRFVKEDMPEHLLDKNKSSPSMITIDDGFEFDLGNRIVEVIHIPGHSPGSIALYDRKSKSLFTGDMANEHTWLQVKHVTSIEDFLSSIHKLQTYKTSVDRLLPGHGGPLKPDHLNSLQAAAEKLLSGECPMTPYSSPFGEEVACHHENVIIVYRK